MADRPLRAKCSQLFAVLEDVSVEPVAKHGDTEANEFTGVSVAYGADVNGHAVADDDVKSRCYWVIDSSCTIGDCVGGT